MKIGDKVITTDGIGTVFIVGKFIGVEVPKKNRPLEVKKRYYHPNEIKLNSSCK